MQTHIRRHITRRLIRFCSVCYSINSFAILCLWVRGFIRGVCFVFVCFPISSSFCACGRLCFMIRASPGYIHMFLCGLVAACCGTFSCFVLFVSSPGALLQISLCHSLLSVFRPSVVRPSVVSFSHFRHLLQNYVGLSWNLVGGIVVTWRSRIAKILPFRYPRWPPIWNSSNDISQAVSQIEPKLDGTVHSGTEIQNC